MAGSGARTVLGPYSQAYDWAMPGRVYDISGRTKAVGCDPKVTPDDTIRFRICSV